MHTEKDNIRRKVFFAVVNAEISLWDAFEQALQKSGLPVSAGRFFPLHHLVGGPLRLRELAQCTHAKESAMSRMVERMVKDGLVMKDRDGVDGRAVCLRITDEGREVERRARRVFDQCLRDVFDGFPEDELADLIELLGRIDASRGEACS